MRNRRRPHLRWTAAALDVAEAADAALAAALVAVTLAAAAISAVVASSTDVAAAAAGNRRRMILPAPTVVPAAALASTDLAGAASAAARAGSISAAAGVVAAALSSRTRRWTHAPRPRCWRAVARSSPLPRRLTRSCRFPHLYRSLRWFLRALLFAVQCVDLLDSVAIAS